MQRDRFEERFSAGNLPNPPADLRRRVLAAVCPHIRPSVTWSDRIWFSRGWRVAAALLLVAVIAVDRLSVVPGPRVGGSGQSAVQSAQAAEEAATQAGLSADQAAMLARRALIASNGARPGRELSLDELITEPR